MLEKIKEIIEEQLNIEDVEITEETRFKITTVGSIIKYLQDKGVEA